MSGADFPSLIDELGAASLEAKALLREVHGAVKDMRRVLADSAAERKRLEECIRAAVEAEVEEHVKAAVAEMGVSVGKAIESATDAVYRRFDKVANILLGEEKQFPGSPMVDVARNIAAGRRCPHCRGLIDDQTGLNGAHVPSDGDVAICWHCGGVARYAEGGRRLRRQTAAEEIEAKADQALQRAVETIQSRLATR